MKGIGGRNERDVGFTRKRVAKRQAQNKLKQVSPRRHGHDETYGYPYTIQSERLERPRIGVREKVFEELSSKA